QKALSDFVRETGWIPGRAVPIAGAMSVFADGRLRALFRKLVERKQPGDTTPRIVFTDWTALNFAVDGLVREAVERNERGPPPPEPPVFRSALEGAVLAP